MPGVLVTATGAAVQLHQVSDDGETLAEAGVLARGPGVGLAESIECKRVAVTCWTASPAPVVTSTAANAMA